ncbi:MAG: response regulator transcription factor [Lachnospiraceae bacterium]|jgi:DNA-binding response OmpR family regulator|nr:response regulator transcription factor [Lachnospiraceae bacterium]MDD7665270.1 response regulator transcription factor [Lachnospiraceae bacterium]MDY4165601.1 response regulator transcription factor [Lachnospiraceae bacterium]
MSRILIVEDEEAIAELERDYLELSGYTVEIENNGDEGLKRAMSEEWDLFILDIMLPGTDGFEICRQIRTEKSTPIIFVSARKDDIDKVKGLGFGADDYITKPFSPSELVARVKAHLASFDRVVNSSSAYSNDDVIRIRGLKIDNISHKVWVDGAEKLLTTKEYDLLYFFAKHPGQVFSKEELFQRIWDQDSVGDIATVTVHVKKIREKIELDKDHPQYIETVWGVGYRMKI